MAGEDVQDSLQDSVNDKDVSQYVHSKSTEKDVHDAASSNSLQDSVNDKGVSQYIHRKRHQSNYWMPEKPTKQINSTPHASLNVYHTIGLRASDKQSGTNKHQSNYWMPEKPTKQINSTPLASLNVYHTIGLGASDKQSGTNKGRQQKARNVVFMRPGNTPKDKFGHYQPGGKWSKPVDPSNRRPAWKKPETISVPEPKRASGGVYYDKPLAVIPREAWGAAEPTGRRSMAHPISYVFTGYTRCNHCVLNESCAKELLFVQRNNMKLGSDIKYNFLISDIGDVYEGRGWDTSPSLPSMYKDIEYTSLLVGFIGRFKSYAPGRNMMQVFKTLIRYGMDNNLIEQGLLQFNLEGWVVTPYD